MIRPFAVLERFFERLFERPAALLFRTRLQPVQLQRRLERAMEAERRHSADRTYVPNRYRIDLHPDDLAGFEMYRETLERDLAAALMQRARSRGYTVVARPAVTLAASPQVSRGDIAVVADVLDPRALRPTALTPRPGPPAGGSASTPSPAAPSHGHTAVFHLPAPSLPRALLEVRVPGRQIEHRPLGAGNLRIGRAADNDLVLADERVSRHHGQLANRQGTLVYTDLGSTNGSYLNGAAVREIVLGAGDVLQVGDSFLALHAEQ